MQLQIRKYEVHPLNTALRFYLLAAYCAGYAGTKQDRADCIKTPEWVQTQADPKASLKTRLQRESERRTGVTGSAS